MKFDYEITVPEIQELSSSDAISAFFAKLGYRTDIRTSQSAGNLGITADGTVRPIKNIELIADQEGLLQVYLFELTNVTITHIRSLCRNFRNRAGNFLLVLTSDYERLDFILVEKYIPSTQKDSKSIVQQQVSIRPRPLTINRKKPETVDIRVLRRFSYTEADPFAQYDKLLSAYAIADWSEEYFNNRALFSDHYLMERLKQHKEWIDDPKPVFAQLREIYKSASSRFGNEPEAVLRKDLLEPVFKTLEFSYKVGKKSDSSDYEPDYRLFQQGTKEKLLAVCLTYSWGRSLDSKDAQRDKETPEENPGAVVVSLLERGEAPWAIVTNGRIWRLYSQKTHSRATNYYEIDLEEILAQTGHLANDPALSFRYFWLMFRSQAFELKTITRDGKEEELCFLDVLLTESEDYAKELGERLKERAFEKIFPYLAEGFIAYIRSVSLGKKDFPQEELDAVFKGTLTLLYRLLFLLYAESRGLLPVKEIRGFYEASLTKLKREIAEKADKIEDEVEKKLKKSYREDEYYLYDRLTELFRVIDKGDVSLNVPVYNGGLFITDPDEDCADDGQNAKFLTETKVPDRFLARALDLLARDIDDKRQDLVFIDYKSLGVRQLGSIYEGLLEFKVRIAPEKMAIIKGKKTEEVIPYKEAVKSKKKILKTGRGKDAKERILSKGTVYLENDKKERKATGSYYTPDYIVEYIVEHVVGPVLQEKFEAMRPKLRDAQKERQAFFKKQEALRQKGIKPEPESKANLVGRELVNEVFDIKVLDPAMGSGHFLVEAVDYITDKTIDFLNRFPRNPIAVYLTEMREMILKEMEEQGITVDAKRLTDVNLLKRHVLKRCIYGVDINLMAVELAKVSLWLDCFTLGAPLSFLDHHLRCGNSLIGVNVEEVTNSIKAKGQTSLLFAKDRFAGLMRATDWMRHVGELSDVTSAQVRQSKEEYHKASDALTSFKRTLDIYTSRWFGNAPIKQVTRKKSKDIARITEYRDITVEVICSDEIDPTLNSRVDNFQDELIKLSSDDQRIIGTAFEASSKYKFFHWELEFPEIFYEDGKKKDFPGFDAIIGNPPWGTSLTSDEKGFISSVYGKEGFNILESEINPYTLFIIRTLHITRNSSLMGMLVPEGWLVNRTEFLLRKYILDNFSLASIALLRKNVIPDAPDVIPTVPVFTAKLNDDDCEVKINRFGFDTSISRLPKLEWQDVKIIKQNSWKSRPYNIFTINQRSRLLDLYGRMNINCIKLSNTQLDRDERNVYISDGIYKSNLVPLIDDSGSRDVFIQASQLSRYSFTCPFQTISNKSFNHLSENDREKMKKAKLLLHAMKKPSVSYRLEAQYFKGDNAEEQYLSPVASNNFLILLPLEKCPWSLYYLCAILSSKLLNIYYTDHYFQVNIEAYTLGDMPIPDVERTTPEADYKKIYKAAMQLYNESLTSEDVLSILNFLDQNVFSREQKTDVSHDYLSYLAMQTIELNKKKGDNMHRFFNYLDEKLKLKRKDSKSYGIDFLSGKTALRNYLGNYKTKEDYVPFNRVLEILQNNSGKIGVKLNSSLENELKKEYLKSLDTLLPIKKQLSVVDQLIDSIIYRIYGLTEEEIAIIEEKEY